MIEKFKQDLTADSGAVSRVEVLWKEECLRDQFVNHTKLIQDSEWVIIDRKEGYIHHDTYPMLTMLFTLRREELPVASFPADIKASELRILDDSISLPKSSGAVGAL